jgi:hypothetical protein
MLVARLRRKAVSLRRKAASLRRKAVSLRRKAASLRRKAVSLRRKTGHLDEVAVTLGRHTHIERLPAVGIAARGSGGCQHLYLTQDVGVSRT